MDDMRLFDALSLEAQRVLDVDATAISNPVPWCEGWTAADVVGHLSQVQRWATAMIEEPGTKPRWRDMGSPLTGPDLLGWYAEGIEPMLDALSGDLEVIVRTWGAEQPTRWWLRRLTHETAVHRWDAEAAAGGPDAARPIAREVAADGIDELFEVFLPIVAADFSGTGETMHLHATDAPGEWQLTFADHAVQVTRTHAKGDVAVKAPASALLLMLWNRVDLDRPELEVFGDPAVADMWRQSARF